MTGSWVPPEQFSVSLEAERGPADAVQQTRVDILDNDKSLSGPSAATDDSEQHRDDLQRGPQAPLLAGWRFGLTGSAPPMKGHRVRVGPSASTGRS